jgi:hypothetical protein
MGIVVLLETSPGHVIPIEVTEDVTPNLSKLIAPSSTALSDLPEGAEPTSAVGNVIDAMRVLEKGLNDIISSVRTAIAASKPSSWNLELSIGFKGKTSPIPVILAGEANASMKLKIEWKP